jgi:hypothetical protein
MIAEVCSFKLPQHPFCARPQIAGKVGFGELFFTESDQMSGPHGQIRGEAMSVEDFRIEKHKRGRSFRASQIEMTVQWVDIDRLTNGRKKIQKKFKNGPCANRVWV